MGVLGYLSAITVCRNGTVVFCGDGRIGQTLHVIADGQHHLVGDQSLCYEI